MKRMCIGLLAACLAAGCAEHANLVTVVSGPELRSQGDNIAPTIPVRLPSGKVTKLSEVTGPLYIVGFVAPPDKDPCFVDPRIVEIAKALEVEPNYIVQFTQPTAGCPLDEATTQACDPPKVENVIRAFDPQKIAWKMFKEPPMETLYLIDRNGYINKVGHLSKYKAIVQRAEQLDEEWDQEQWNEWMEQYER